MHRKSLTIGLCLLLSLLLFAACQQQAAPTDPQPTDPPQPAAPTETVCSFEAQYIRTDGYHEDLSYPIVYVIHSAEELKTYYEENKSLYDLDRRENPASDQTIGFLDACDRYDDSYFENRILLMVLLQEGSGSIRHQVDSLTLTENSQLSVAITSLIPEVGTDDMALWHILIAPEAGISVSDAEDVFVYLDDKLAWEGHTHQLAENPQIVKDPITGYCGNTQTTVKIEGKEYTFMYDNSVALTDLLVNLDYNKYKVCKCLPQFQVVTEFGSYGIHLTEGYARCEKGQAPLTREQINTIREIIEEVQSADGYIR